MGIVPSAKYSVRVVPSQSPDMGRSPDLEQIVACVIPGECEFTVEGECRGRITREKLGDGGFGYDPIFLIPELGKTFAQMPEEEKNRISHRARALAALRDKLTEMGVLHAEQ